MYRQHDRGPQGLCTAVENSEIHMLAFDRRFLARLEVLGIILLLFWRYVDDLTVVGPVINHGWVYNCEANRLKLKSELSGDETPADYRTMEAFLQWPIV